jgi:very-short-patch-repair endonuclease
VGGSRIGLARQLRRNVSQPERTLWSELKLLRPMGFHFRRQVPIGPYFADFICHRARLAVEVDGDLHGSSKARANDAFRTRFFESEGYEVVRVTNTDVALNLDGVLGLILSRLEKTPPTPTPTPIPSPGGGGEQTGEAI